MGGRFGGQQEGAEPFEGGRRRLQPFGVAGGQRPDVGGPGPGQLALDRGGDLVEPVGDLPGGTEASQ